MNTNGCGMKSLRTSKHRLIQPLNRLLNVMLFKYSTIRAMSYNRVLGAGLNSFLIKVLFLKSTRELVGYFFPVSLHYKLLLRNRLRHYSFETAFSLSGEFQFPNL